jgi:preprotein translocase subunit SecF
MGAKKLCFGVLTALLSVIAVVWFFTQQDTSEAIDYKELYRQTFHTQAAEMEAAQRKRWNDQKS